MEQKQYFLLYYNEDTGCCFIKVSPVERKTEINPIGYRVKFFQTLKEAIKMKRRIDDKPFMATQYLNRT